MKHRLFLSACLALFAATAALAQTPLTATPPPGADFKPGPVAEWAKASGGNGHRYQAVETPLGATWNDALAWASKNGGFLATIQSADENTFIFRLVDDPKYWLGNPPYNDRNLGPWLGGFRAPDAALPAEGWKWLVDASDVGYTNWAFGQPDRRAAGEEFLHFVSNDPAARQPVWNDLAADRLLRGFVVEYFTSEEIAAKPKGDFPRPEWKYPPVTPATAGTEKSPPPSEIVPSPPPPASAASDSTTPPAENKTSENTAQPPAPAAPGGG